MWLVASPRVWGRENDIGRVPVIWRHGRRVAKTDWVVITVLERNPALEVVVGGIER